MNICAYGTTTEGLVREHNEDCFSVDEARRLFIVADGMGGHAAGEVASRVAVETVKEFLQSADEEATWPYESNPRLSLEGNKLAQAIRIANRCVLDEVEKNERYRGMGTTLVALTVRPDEANSEHAYIGYVGDSRTYRIREGKLEQLTLDHSWISAQVESGAISAEAARRHPLRNVITRALGSDEEVEADIIECDVRPGDLFILCTDGLNTMISDEEILKRALAGANDLEAMCTSLVEGANEAGGEDNTTVVMVSVEEDDQ
jgi:protein phosphatase